MRPSQNRKFVSTGLAVVLSLGALSACGSDDDSDSSSTTAAVAAVAGSGDEMSTEKLDANTASEDDMKAKFEAAGLPNADTWADEIAEYRPFDSMDAMHEKLKEYEISDETWAQLSELVMVN